MDIYEYAKEFNADYIDKHGNIYKVQDYNYAIKNGLPTEGIKVFDNEGNFIGTALKKS